MIKIALGDWVLSRSEAFKILLSKFRDHKIATKEAFDKVKKRHNKYEDHIEDHEIRLRELETILAVLHENDPIKIKKKIRK